MERGGVNDVDLTGEWRAMRADTSDAEDFRDPDTADDHWVTMHVPSHWSAHPGLGSHPGQMWLRRHFRAARAEPERRRWLTFDGVFTHAGVWLDGSYQGEIDNYFAPRSFDVTDALTVDRDHVVALEVSSGTTPWARRDREPGATDPGGIWRPVRIIETGAVRISRLKVLCTDATPERATLSLLAELDTTNAMIAGVRTIVTPASPDASATATDETSRPLAQGANRLRWNVTIERPQLWWPWELGDQPLFDVRVEVVESVGDGQRISDVANVTTGLRHVNEERGVLMVNGRVIPVRGIGGSDLCVLPVDADDDVVRAGVEKARQAGLNLLVRDYWLEPTAFYEAADRLGMMVWQGMPSMHGPGSDKRTLKLARQAIELLGRHPSITGWLRPAPNLGDRVQRHNPLRSTIERADTTRPCLETPRPAVGAPARARHRVSSLAPSVLRTRAAVSALPGTGDDLRDAVDAARRSRTDNDRYTLGFVAWDAEVADLNGAAAPVRFSLQQHDRDGDRARLSLHLVNDLGSAITDAIVRVHASSDAQSWNWSFAGEVAALSSGYIGTLRLARIDAWASTEIDIELESPTVTAKQATTLVIR